MRKLAKKYPDPGHRFELAVTLRALAEVQQASGQTKAAQTSATESVDLLTDLVKLVPDDAEFQEQLKAARQLLDAASKPADASKS
jgi:hypothetical protein